MKLLLDTNVISKIIRGRELVVRERYRAAVAAQHQLYTPSIVVHELRYGARRGPDPEKNLERIGTFLTSLDGVVDFTSRDAEIAGDIRAALAGGGQPIGPYNLLIAAQALRLETTLITGNTREFARVSGLKWIDWTAA